MERTALLKHLTLQTSVNLLLSLLIACCPFCYVIAIFCPLFYDGVSSGFERIDCFLLSTQMPRRQFALFRNHHFYALCHTGIDFAVSSFRRHSQLYLHAALYSTVLVALCSKAEQDGCQ